MAELKIGGNDVSKIYYKDKDVSGSQMLESGTIVYKGSCVDGIHLLSVDPNWKNISKLGFILIMVSNNMRFKIQYLNVDDFNASPQLEAGGKKLNVSRTYSGNEYKLNLKNISSTYNVEIYVAE